LRRKWLGREIPQLPKPVEKRSKPDSVPTPEEIRRQLERILKNSRFSGSQRFEDFLEFVVDKALKNELITQSIVAARLYPKKFAHGDISDVRVIAKDLRKAFAEYYAQEGRGDPVQIRLPDPPENQTVKLKAGTAYKPLFSYNPRYPAEREYQRGLLHLSQLSPLGLVYALSSFKKAVQLGHRHPAVCAAISEAYLINSLYGCPEPATHYLFRARETATLAVKLNPDSWHGHAALATVHTCLLNWSAAVASFEKALECNASETRSYPGYAFYLLAAGKRDEALQLVKNKAESKSGDPAAERMYPLFLYATRQFKQAERLLRNLHDTFETDWIVMLTLVLLFLALDRPELALKVNNRLINTMRHMAAIPEIWPGLTILVYLRLGGKYEQLARDEAVKLEQHYKETRDREPLQLALMYMGQGKSEKAMEQLARGVRDRFPFMIWLHLWPIFDPLRDRPAFRALIKQLKLPVSK
jgi:tetratricopeptide (TPR) repeat protein